MEAEYSAIMSAAFEKQREKNKALTRLETRKAVALNFTPSSAYYISGHGEETLETFIVPPNCVVIVKAQVGEVTYGGIMEKICFMKNANTILKDPFKSYHMSKIIKEFGSLAVYKPGDLCPNFMYTLTACYEFSESYKCYNLNSGLLDISELKCDEDMLQYRDISGNDISYKDAISYVKDLYKDSKYPVIEQIEEDIRSLTHEKIIEHKSFLETTPFFNEWNLVSKKIKTLASILKSIRISQRELCEKFTGVFYNFVCRARGEYTNIVYGPPERNFSEKFYISKPRGFEEVSDLSGRQILKERIGESVLRRGPLKNYYNFMERPKLSYLERIQKILKGNQGSDYTREEPTKVGAFRRPRPGHWKIKEGGTRRKTRKILTANRSKKNRKLR